MKRLTYLISAIQSQKHCKFKLFGIFVCQLVRERKEVRKYTAKMLVVLYEVVKTGVRAVSAMETVGTVVSQKVL